MAAAQQFDGLDGRRGDPNTGEPAAEALLDEPLDFLSAAHYRQREIALLLTLAADGAIEAEKMRSVRHFLLRDLGEHILDEETVFFPALRRQCLPEDNIERLINLIAHEHEADRKLGAQAADTLATIIAGGKMAVDDERRLRALADHLRGHIALENGVLLPIARVRLDQEARREIADGLKARRKAAKG